VDFNARISFLASVLELSVLLHVILNNEVTMVILLTWLI
jgi:hypothetical protein